jgi:hypothetical protein
MFLLHPVSQIKNVFVFNKICWLVTCFRNNKSLATALYFTVRVKATPLFNQKTSYNKTKIYGKEDLFFPVFIVSTQFNLLRPGSIKINCHNISYMLSPTMIESLKNRVSEKYTLAKTQN